MEKRITGMEKQSRKKANSHYDYANEENVQRQRLNDAISKTDAINTDLKQTKLVIKDYEKQVVEIDRNLYEAGKEMHQVLGHMLEDKFKENNINLDISVESYAVMFDTHNNPKYDNEFITILIKDDNKFTLTLKYYKSDPVTLFHTSNLDKIFDFIIERYK